VTLEEVIVEATALRSQKKFDEADALLDEAMAEHPDHADLYIQFAYVAVDRRSAAEQLARWELVLRKFPHLPIGYWRVAEQLMIRAELAKAESIIDEGYAKFPDDRYVLWQYASIAHRKRDWAEAIRRWEAALMLYPDMPQISDGLGAVRLAISLEEVDAVPNRLPPPIIHKPDDVPLRDMMMRFESLGSNCEFGLVQRFAGAEPLGLMRWSNSDTVRISKMLRERCDGVGSSEFMRLDLGGSGEYSLSDIRYFGMHTFIHFGEQEESKLVTSLQRRLRFLAEKLMSDLTSGEKIFVYRQDHKPIEEHEMTTLLKAMRIYGKAKLFCVQRPIDPALDGTVESRGDGLFVGYMGALDSNPMAARERFDLWIDLLRRVEHYR
jgi:tetratricopeptide (TPR) repeat protein